MTGIDFTQDWVNGWIITIVLINLLGCLWLLWFTRKQPDDHVPEGESMGHSFDGIEELNNPLPHWWLNLFYATIAFAFIYLTLYPGWGDAKGVLGWTSHGQWKSEMEKANNQYDRIFADFASESVAELAKNPEAVKIGQRLFGNNCAVCHGSDARGNAGYPNLTDGDWLYGGTPEKIVETITGGRQSIGMPSFAGAPYNLDDAGIQNLVAHVLSLSGRTAQAGDAEAGKLLYTQKGCLACHGPDGKGMQAMGAPNLTDDIWLYGGTEKSVFETIHKGRKGNMPSFKDTLGKDRIHVVATYVYSLSH